MRIAVMMIAAIVLLIACGNQDETESCNGAVRIGAVASADEDVQSNRVEHSDETTPDDEIAPSNGALADYEVAYPSSTGQVSNLHSAKRRMPALLRLRIYNASAIVRATLISTSPATGFDVDKDDAVLTYQFRVSEYLKGSGASEVTVRARRSGSQGTKVEALQVAMDSLASRDTSRDTHEAVLFLSESTSDDPFHFLRSGPYPSLHYTTYTLIWVWLPAKDPPAAAGASSSDDSSLLFLMSEPALGLSWPTVRPTTMSLGELRSEVAAVDALLAAGDGTRGKAAIAALADAVGLEVDALLLEAGIKAEDGIEVYRECVVAGWRYELSNGDRPTKPRSRYEDEYPLASGAPAGTVIKSFPWPARKHIEGADKDLFKAVLTDVDDRRDNGFGVDEATGRPLPAGTYQYKSYFQHIIYVPCDFFPFYSYTYHKVVVTAPKGTLHELFFDPVPLGSGVDTDASNGVLKPASFTDTNGASATIQSIAWEAPSTGSEQAGTVKVVVTPNAALAGQTVDFIELDGTVSLSLDVADATVDAANNTLSWSVSSQPWHDGDKLMVRIREDRK